MLSFKEVDPSVLGPKYKKNKKTETVKTTEFKSDPEGTKEAIKNVTEEFNNKIANGEIVGTEEVKRAIENVLNEPKENAVSKPTEYAGPNLKPCPFCSGTAKLVTDMKSLNEDAYFAQIKCLDCGTIGPRAFDKAHDGMFVFDAISKWNRRK